MKEKHKQAFMKTAYTFAECSHAIRLKVGCVIVKDNRIISIVTMVHHLDGIMNVNVKYYSILMTTIS